VLRALILVAVVVAMVGSAGAEERLTPSWMTVHDNPMKVGMDIVAGFNPNNNNWNFNGYYDGSLTVVVPEGWRVEIDFTNRDANYPHSLVVIEDPGDPSAYPEEAGRAEVAIPRAYSKSPTEGLFSNEEDVVAFKAAAAGDYLFYCGVHGHGTSGMWVYFKISADAEQPYVTIADDAEEGRA
jgi:sulfocyanin